MRCFEVQRDGSSWRVQRAPCQGHCNKSHGVRKDVILQPFSSALKEAWASHEENLQLTIDGKKQQAHPDQYMQHDTAESSALRGRMEVPLGYDIQVEAAIPGAAAVSQRDGQAGGFDYFPSASPSQPAHPDVFAAHRCTPAFHRHSSTPADQSPQQEVAEATEAVAQSPQLQASTVASQDDKSAWLPGLLPPPAGVFNFASGRGVVFSDEARRKAAQLITSPAQHNPRTSPEADGDEEARWPVGILPPPAGVFGFASGRDVVISDEARSKAAKLVDCGSQPSQETDTSVKADSGPVWLEGVVPPAVGVFGFASGRNIVISDQARSKAAQIVDCRSQSSQEIDTSVKADSGPVWPEGVVPPAVGVFGFASGRKIIISEEACSKAAQLVDSPSQSRTGDQAAKDKLVVQPCQSLSRDHPLAVGSMYDQAGASHEASIALGELELQQSPDKDSYPAASSAQAGGGEAVALGSGKVSACGDAHTIPLVPSDSCGVSQGLQKRSLVNMVGEPLVTTSDTDAAILTQVCAEEGTLLTQPAEEQPMERSLAAMQAVDQQPEGCALETMQPTQPMDVAVEPSSSALMEGDVMEARPSPVRLAGHRAIQDGGAEASASSKHSKASHADAGPSPKRARLQNPELPPNVAQSTPQQQLGAASASEGHGSPEVPAAEAVNAHVCGIQGGKRQLIDAAAPKAKRSLGDDSAVGRVGSGASSAQAPASAAFGLLTASGKTVDVSSASMANDQSLLARSSQQDASLPQPAPEPLAFQTASGKEVDVSDATLAKAKHLLTLDSQKEAQGGGKAVPQPAEEPFAFQTASGKKVDVSDASLAKVKYLLSSESQKEADGDGDEAGDGLPQSAAEPFAFQTASGEKVDVSDASLAKVKDLLTSDSQEEARAGGSKAGDDQPGTPTAAPTSNPDAAVSARPQQQNREKALPAIAELRCRPLSAHTPAAKGVAASGRGASGSMRSTRGRGSGSLFKAPRRRNAFMSPMRNLVLQKGMTPEGASRGPKPRAGAVAGSRLNIAGTPIQPRAALHSLQGGLVAGVLASLPSGCEMAALETSAQGQCMLDSSASTLTVTLQGQEKSTEELGAERFLQMLLEAGGESRFATEEWVANHLRWILWKLACYEQRYPHHLAGKLLMPAVVLDELKKRYERELHQGHRSLLKRVLEGDEAPGHLIVLCVAAIIPPQSQQGRVQLEVTDGWYSVRAVLDDGLIAMTQQNRLRVGEKLRILGAEISAERQVDALEASKSSFLKLHINGTHKAAPDAKLGWQPSRTVLVPLHAVQPNGGPVARTLVVLQRKYPRLLWLRTHNGASATYTPRAHAQRQQSTEASTTKLEEDIVKELQAQEVLHSRQRLGSGAALSPGEKLYCELVASGGFHEDTVLPPEQQAQIERYVSQRAAAKEAMKARRLAEEMENRGLERAGGKWYCNLLVSSVVHQAKVEDEDAACQVEAIIRVWGPTDDIDCMVEGQLYDVTNLAVSNSRRRELELHTTAATHWRSFVAKPGSPLRFAFHPRQALQLSALPLLAAGAMLDFQGILVGISATDPEGGQCSQWLFLADETTSADGWLLAVKLRAGRLAMDFLDPSEHMGRLLCLRDLRFGGQDAPNSLWQASGNEHTTVQLVKEGSQHKVADQRHVQLAEWAANNAALLADKQQKVQQLMGGSW